MLLKIYILDYVGGLVTKIISPHRFPETRLLAFLALLKRKIDSPEIILALQKLAKSIITWYFVKLCK